MAYPVEGWRRSAVVLMRQHGEAIAGEVYGAGEADADRAWRQALATVSLDVDGRGFVDIGRRCSFIIGHRISILQTRRIRQRMGDQCAA